MEHQDEQWVRNEERLWNEIHKLPSRAVTPHSKPLPLGSEARKKFDKELLKQRQREFAAGWRSFEEWVKH
jgi:hypothetical protein